ncbi:BACON domain-containing protein [Acanthopleuribacter pedis]|uniref:BACON domain-containing protein n=1 Tax=Acanthopleuribacter pedis TaxID=442870 RepID=A0A8J7Q446_9BACT|nr:BACON domain-containing carbohydrate-binding protein [Acanthopleuribacter pedis]MBO1320227.1 hypothetical protein [Acanthopleuribacter pedis]
MGCQPGADQNKSIQDQTPCRLALSAPSAVFDAAGGKGDLQVQTEGDCVWVANSGGAAWVVIEQGTATQLNYRVTANTGPTSRNAVITFKNKGVVLRTFSIFQEGSACGLKLAPTQVAMSADGGEGTLLIKEADPCKWTAERKVDWIAIETRGIGEVVYKVEPNTSQQSRAGSVQFLIDQKEMGSFWVVQEGIQKVHNPCSLIVDEKPVNWSAKGGSSRVTFKEEGDCRWQVRTNADWIELPNRGVIKQGETSFSYRIMANVGLRSRTGTLTITQENETGGNPVTRNIVIIQDASQCEVRVSQSRIDLSMEAHDGLLEITSSCDWRAVSDVDWLTVAKTEGETGAALRYQAQTNRASDARIGTIRVEDRTLVVVQKGTPDCRLDVVPQSAAFAIEGGTGNMVISSPDDCDWRVSTSAPWINILGDPDEISPERVGYEVQSNTAVSPRTATIRVGDQLFTVTQEGVSPCVYIAQPSHTNVLAQGGKGTFRLMTRDYCEWQARSNSDWIQLTGDARGKGEATIGIEVRANSESTARTGVIEIGNANFVVIQEGRAPCSVTLTAETLQMGAKGGRQTVTISTGENCHWQAGSATTWLKIVSNNLGTGQGEITIEAESNEEGKPRIGTLRISDQTIKVMQEGTGEFQFTVIVRDRDGNFVSNQPVTFHNGEQAFETKTNAQGIAGQTVKENRGVAYSINGRRRDFGSNLKLVHMLEDAFEVRFSLVVDDKNRTDGVIWVRSQSDGIERKTEPGSQVRLPYGTYFVSYENGDLIHTEVHTITKATSIEIDIATMPNVYYRTLYRDGNQRQLQAKVDEMNEPRRHGYHYFLARYWLARFHWDRGQQSSAKALLADLYGHWELWLSMNVRPQYVVAYLDCLANDNELSIIGQITEQDVLINEFNKLQSGERDAWWRFQFLYHRIKALNFLHERGNSFQKRRYRKRLQQSFRWINEIPVSTINNNPMRYQELKELKAKWEKRS